METKEIIDIARSNDGGWSFTFTVNEVEFEGWANYSCTEYKIRKDNTELFVRKFMVRDMLSKLYEYILGVGKEGKVSIITA